LARTRGQAISRKLLAGQTKRGYGRTDHGVVKGVKKYGRGPGSKKKKGWRSVRGLKRGKTEGKCRPAHGGRRPK